MTQIRVAYAESTLTDIAFFLGNQVECLFKALVPDKLVDSLPKVELKGLF